MIWQITNNSNLKSHFYYAYQSFIILIENGLVEEESFSSIVIFTENCSLPSVNSIVDQFN